AAVAASVLIGTANQVREQAQSTGNQAINNVASGFIVHDVVGTVDKEENKIDEIVIYLRLAAGSPRINMANVMITLVSGDVNQVMNMHPGESIDGWRYEDKKCEVADINHLKVETETGYLMYAPGEGSEYVYYPTDNGVLERVQLDNEYYGDDGKLNWETEEPNVEFTAYSEGDGGTAATLKAGEDEFSLYVLTDIQNDSVKNSYFTERVQATDAEIPWRSSNYVVAQGDLIAVHVVIDGNESISFTQAGSIKIMPAYGQMNQINFETPESFSTKFVSL
ncbi:MAG: hypothetical protein GX369_01655, partial [Euryarchaeota archaeon]|nr:hypothetical protein [Euryarchaeota archaeon]